MTNKKEMLLKKGDGRLFEGNCAKYPLWGSKPHKTVVICHDISVSYGVIDTLFISIIIRFFA